MASSGHNPYLPDPQFTPGVYNPGVTQSTIASTICKANWTKTIRPPVRYTNKLKAEQMAKLGLKGKPNSYEEDHLVSLEVGGDPDDPQNLWPEPWPEARLKDVVETNLAHRVCAGTITLAEARKILATDWTVEFERIKGMTVAQALAKKRKK